MTPDELEALKRWVELDSYAEFKYKESDEFEELWGTVVDLLPELVAIADRALNASWCTVTCGQISYCSDAVRDAVQKES